MGIARHREPSRPRDDPNAQPSSRTPILGDGPYRFDSDFFPVAAAFPNINISTTALPLCEQIVLGVVARPSPDNCFADCDRSTGSGVLDIFDFLCFQHAFVSQRPYACACDTSTGPGTCDIFDFLCFQNAFVAGCL